MKVRGKKLTRKQKEALSAQGWDFRLYLCVRDGPDFMELVNRTTGKYIIVADSYTMTEADKDALREGGIFFKAAAPAL